MTFYITKGSTLPTLQMELIDDGRNDFHKFNECIQAATITFTMVDADTKVPKISNAKARIRLRESDSCEEQYLICYEWKERDTRAPGTYLGHFTITFDDSLKNDSYSYPIGVLNMPIRDDVYIVVKDE